MLTHEFNNCLNNDEEIDIIVRTLDELDQEEENGAIQFI